MTLRIIGAVVALISAAIHFWEYFFNGYNATGVGIPFLINGVAGIVIAILLLTARHNWLPLLLLFGFGVLTLGGFVTSWMIGLFGVHETWSGTLKWVAAIAEAIAIVLGPVIFAREQVRDTGP